MKKALVLISLLVWAVSAMAQTEIATLSGRVTDSTGAVIAGALCTVTQIQTGTSRTTVTNNDGIYVIPDLKPGDYRLTVEKEGFQKVIKTGITLHEQDNLAENVDLRVGSSSESVTVVAENTAIQTSSAIATVVNSEFVDQLPLNGRTFQALLELTPGVVPSADPRLFEVNGQRGVSNALSIDGLSANIGSAIVPAQVGLYSNGAVSAMTATGTTQALATMDELQEFTVQTTGYGAQFGSQSGAQISFVTKSGTNKFHGSAYEYFRNEALDANSWFLNNTVPSTKRLKLRQNDLGGTLGGPIIKNRTFFFAAFEYDPLIQPFTSNNTVPTQTYDNAAAPALLPLLKLFPLPNGTIAANGFSGIYTVNQSLKSFADVVSVKLDQNIGTRLTMFARYHRTPSNAATPSLYLSNLYTNTQTITYGATYAATSNTLSDTRFNWSRSSSGRQLSFISLGGSTPVPSSDVFPAGYGPQNSSFLEYIFDDGFQSAQELDGENQKSLQHQWQITENVSRVWGKHKFDVGGDWRRLSPQIKEGIDPLIFEIVSGANNQADVNSQVFGSGMFSVNSFSLYVADNWKVTPRLTIDLGVRWELEPPPGATGNSHVPFAAQNFNANNPAVATLAPIGTPIWKTRYDNFAPRFGFAYNLFNTPGRNTVVRGAFGIYYDLGVGDPLSFLITAPYLQIGPTVVGAYPSVISNPALAPTPVNLTPPFTTLLLFNPNMRMPYTTSWSFGVQQSLGRNQSLTIDYIGNRGHNLLMQVAEADPGNPLVTATGTLTQSSNLGKSWYNALQVQFNRHLSKGLQAIVSYTWSHSIDNSSDEVSTFPPGAVFPVDANKASSNFDVRQILTAGATYQVPMPYSNSVAKAVLGGWSLDPMVRCYTPMPINVTYTYVVSNTLSYTLYPNSVPGQPQWISNPKAPGGKQANFAAYSIPTFPSLTQISQGNAGRNVLRGFGANQVDLALRREFSLTERFKLQVSAEMYNIFNHPNFANPSMSLGSVSNGKYTPPSGVAAGTFGESAGLLSSVSISGLGSGTIPIYAFGGQRDVQLVAKIRF